MSSLSETSENLGASYLGDGRCRFVVWAPSAQMVEVHLFTPRERVIVMERDDRGYHRAVVDDVMPGSRYMYRLDGQKERPDPASRFQPQDVHGPSEVVDPRYTWAEDRWFGLPLRAYILYELHVGTFTTEGTFQAIIPHLDDLKDLGITAVEIMPVAQFPGNRNWGYDGVYPFAVQNSYGGPVGLKRLVEACHQRELAVVLDVVYNHLGPEGNYLWDFGPYFTDRYRTPWGAAINFDGPQSDEVRRFFVENALYWISEFHVDALRLDAVHAIYDRSALPFLQELAEAVHQRAEQLNRRVYAIAESDLNDARLIRSRDLGGYGLDAQWADDLHHALHVLLTGEHGGYYRDFGTVEQLARIYRDGYAFSGQYSPYRQRRHGNSPRFCDAHQFVVYAQNHDQIGNRMLGERLTQLIPFDGLKLAAAAVLLSPFIPLLFMGEEYGETAPFQYFISHLDPQLVEAVRKGRRDEFSAFAWLGEPADPQDEATFRRAKLDHRLRQEGHHRILLEYYKELIRFRKTVPALASPSKERIEAFGWEQKRVLFVRRWCGKDEAVLILNFGVQASVLLPIPAGHWHRRLDSTEKKWQGNGSQVAESLDSEGEVVLDLGPKAAILLTREKEV